MKVETVPLRCVDCGGSLNGAAAAPAALECASCGARHPIVDDVLVALPSQAERDECVRGSRIDQAGDFYDEAYAAQVYGRSEQHMRAHVAAAEAQEQQTAGRKGLVLEIGSGRGVCAGIGGGDYVAVDYSLSSLRSMGDHTRLLASAERLPPNDGCCRLVFTFATLEHVLAPHQAFAEIDRVLAPGGIALVRPAWHCVRWQDNALRSQPWRSTPLRDWPAKHLAHLALSLPAKALRCLPFRSRRRLGHLLCRRPTELAFRRLQACYDRPQQADADAACSLDCHEGILYFESRGYQIVSHQRVASRLFARHDDVIVSKPQ